jgi:IclR family acetate operon transcriptional repressor
VDATPALQHVSDTSMTAASNVELDSEGVRSVDRAASLLIALGNWDGEAGVTELARSLGLHKSTTSRLLATLQKRGLVQQGQESGKYRLGLAVIRLGGQAERALDLRSIAMRELEGVARAVRETTTLGVVEGDSVVTIGWSDASGMGHDRKWTYLPLHATAPGKVLLSNRPEREVIRLSKIGLTPYTSRTIVRVDLLLEEIARVRRRGFATAFGEHEPSVNAVAVPVFDQRGSVVAALEVRAPSQRIQPSRVPELIERIRAAAAAITEQIGGSVAYS